MKNIDKIKGMSVWELAEFIHDVSCNSAKITTCEEECNKCEYSDSYCVSGIGEWLNSEAGGENDD